MSVSSISSASSADSLALLQQLFEAKKASVANVESATGSESAGSSDFSSSIMSAMDANGDGSVSEDELASAFEKSSSELLAQLDDCNSQARAYEASQMPPQQQDEFENASASSLLNSEASNS